MRTLITLALLSASVGAHAQEAPVIARQVRIPVDQVLGGKIRIDKDERDTLKEQRRHHRKVEKELRKLIRDDRFQLPRGATGQPTRVRTLPPGSSSY
jgi:hypothetical protein